MLGIFKVIYGMYINTSEIWLGKTWNIQVFWFQKIRTKPVRGIPFPVVKLLRGLF